MKKLSRDHRTALTFLLITAVAVTAGWLGVPGFRRVVTRMFSSDSPPTSKVKLEKYEYLDDTIQITMKYPPNWDKQNIADPIVTGDLARFSPNEQSDSKPCKTELMIKVKIFSEKLLSIDEYKNSTIRRIKEYAIAPAILEETTEDTLSNFRAYKIIYTGKYGKCTFKRLEIGTVRNNQAYYITYRAEPSEYEQFLPPAQDMIKSFKIIQ